MKHPLATLVDAVNDGDVMEILMLPLNRIIDGGELGLSYGNGL